MDNSRQVDQPAGGVDAGPQGEGEEAAELDALGATFGRPRLCGREEVVTDAGAPALGVHGHQAQRRHQCA